MLPLEQSKTEQQTDAGIPARKEQRDMIKQQATEFAAGCDMAPPVSMETLRNLIDQFCAEHEVDPKYHDYAAVVLNNEMWRSNVRRLPFQKRLLLLPQCLKHSESCPAMFDEYGLLCRHCGRCVIDSLCRQAEDLGYTVLIAEGSPVVMALIQTGQVEGIIGVSCLSVLERVFPYMEAGAVPGIAVPLLKEGCKDTRFDKDWITEILDDFQDASGVSVTIEPLKQAVRILFETDQLQAFFNPSEGAVVTVAMDWMAGYGKRWRPILLAGTVATLTGLNVADLPETVRQAAVAVECFHKASLIHDDIEDQDAYRYDQKTIHAEYGVPIALNTGDYLLGEGYRLLSELEVTPEQAQSIFSIASAGHKTLCLGQGDELSWRRERKPLTVDQIVEIFEKKTAPAFAVALKIGAVLADAPPELLNLLDTYSRALGIAYQIRDDWMDWKYPNDSNTPDCFSIVPAVAMICSHADDAQRLQELWLKSNQEEQLVSAIAEVVPAAALDSSIHALLDDYKKQALDAIERVKQDALKILLRRMMTKIFDNITKMGCCDDDSTLADPDHN
ncbi:MAG: polyprenyl synthetase family protein [Sedimentisphaerales bacterium]|nr:polyprenyl synthetase family protein [Sedimentisphaerales bacterium]